MKSLGFEVRHEHLTMSSRVGEPMEIYGMLLVYVLACSIYFANVGHYGGNCKNVGGSQHSIGLSQTRYCCVVSPC